MTVVFDAEPLLAFAFDEPGAGAVERWLDKVYDGDVDGYVTTINLAEFRYVAARKVSSTKADEHISNLFEMGIAKYRIDGLWNAASTLKASHSISLGDAYAVAAAREIETPVTLLVGADDDYDAFEDGELLERFRDEPV